eukprot:6109798-Alexandrium_andersonii.AAC.1
MARTRPATLCNPRRSPRAVARQEVQRAPAPQRTKLRKALQSTATSLDLDGALPCLPGTLGGL